MARNRDENKRSAIIDHSKTLFSKKGFANTSISDIVKATHLPVGTIYTYFKNKEDILHIIIEEGWQDLNLRLQEALSSEQSLEQKLDSIFSVFLPELIQDIDLINILFFEALRYAHIEEKLDTLTSTLYEFLHSFPNRSNSLHFMSKKDTETALLIYFLGIINAIKISRSTKIDISKEDILVFVRKTAENSLL